MVTDKSARKWSVRFRAGPKHLVDDPRTAQANSIITANLIEKVYDLVKINRRHIAIVGGEGGYQPSNCVDICS